MKYFALLFFCVPVLVTALSCSRQGPKGPGFQMDLQSGLSTDEFPMMVAVNITSGDGSVAQWLWEQPDSVYHCSNCAPSAMPNPIVIDNSNLNRGTLKTGSNQLIQVLVVKLSPETFRMTFDYGDVRRSISTGENSFSLLVNTFGESAKEGWIVGRYLDASGQPWTAPIVMQFSPPNSEAPMDLFDDQVFGGWVNLMVFDTMSVRYIRKDTGGVLFGGPITQSLAALNDSSVKRITTPDMWYDFGGGARQLVSPSGEIFLGHWQDGSALGSGNGKYVYHDNSTFDSDWAFPDGASGSNVSWPSDFLINGNTANQTLGSDPLVSSDGNTIKVEGSLFEYGSHAKLFRGPFMMYKTVGGYYTHLDMTHDGVSSVGVEWKYAPGAVSGSSPMDGLSLFYTLDAAGLYTSLSSGPVGIDCNLLGTDFTRVDLPTSSESYSIAGISDSVAPDLKVVLCPHHPVFGFMGGAIESDGWGSGGSGG